MVQKNTKKQQEKPRERHPGLGSETKPIQTFFETYPIKYGNARNLTSILEYSNFFLFIPFLCALFLVIFLLVCKICFVDIGNHII
jgi:hypothetical protein